MEAGLGILPLLVKKAELHLRGAKMRCLVRYHSVSVYCFNAVGCLTYMLLIKQNSL